MVRRVGSPCRIGLGKDDFGVVVFYASLISEGLGEVREEQSKAVKKRKVH